MDFCRNVSVSGEYQQEQVLSPPCSKLGTLASTGTLDDIFPAQNTEVDVSLEWLSIFVEDCLTSTGNCLPAAVEAVPTNVQKTSTKPSPTKPLQLQQKPKQSPPSLQKFVIPVKARSKRKRVTTAFNSRLNPLTSWSKHLYPYNQNLQLVSSDPPLLQQAYWLADSELIVTKKDESNRSNSSNNMVRNSEEEEEEEGSKVVEGQKMVTSKESLGLSLEVSSGQQPRRCTHCLAQRTPQWRAGPLGPKTLCNACGVRYKSGRLLPEYRPAKSPTFVSYLHSNSHKKVMEMRMALLPSVPGQQ